MDSKVARMFLLSLIAILEFLLPEAKKMYLSQKIWFPEKLCMEKRKLKLK